MKRLLIVVVVAALLWSGYWVLGAIGAKRGLESWMEARRAEGWQADYAEFSLRGYPNRFDALWENLALADPGTGLAVEMPRFGLYALSWKPGHLIAVWPDRFDFRSPEERFSLSNDDLRASLRVTPGPLLELQRAQLTGQTLVLSGATEAAMDSLSLAMAQDDGDDSRYRLGLAAEGLSLPLSVADWLQADGLPQSMRELRLDADVTFTRPWDLRALEEARPQPTRVELHLARAAWGELLLQVTADLDVNARGLLSGEAHVQARQWQQMLQMAVAAGAVPEEMAGSIEQGLSMMAGASGNPNSLDLTLTLREGRIWAGLIPLGPAPVLRLR
ncbi:DUF2125 domain-containing protein [Pseudooceanicola marinus]|uniref:DUF2125 domain-containing protein n=1 Tax=Pseudooceanicola marinus TaxID=396013 RepID=UPI001CD456A0|nr:DUF2125 domain-containing protein [Pseudooceanicola marinus]MCA1336521.1 DUF2125 domain-containing protein [Pseudooceanicola marinus]